MRDVLLTGKVYEAVRRRGSREATAAPRPRARHGPTYDAVVLDAPPTGRITRFLDVNAEVAGLAQVGPIRSQADSITRLLHSPQTAVHLVTLLEEMPVQETPGRRSRSWRPTACRSAASSSTRSASRCCGPRS